MSIFVQSATCPNGSVVFACHENIFFNMANIKRSQGSNATPARMYNTFESAKDDIIAQMSAPNCIGGFLELNLGSPRENIVWSHFDIKDMTQGRRKLVLYAENWDNVNHGRNSIIQWGLINKARVFRKKGLNIGSTLWVVDNLKYLSA